MCWSEHLDLNPIHVVNAWEEDGGRTMVLMAPQRAVVGARSRPNGSGRQLHGDVVGRPQEWHGGNGMARGVPGHPNHHEAHRHGVGWRGSHGLRLEDCDKKIREGTSK